MTLVLDVPPDVSLSSYSGLVVSIGAWLERDDLTDRAPTFIAMAEARFNRLLRTPQMETAISVLVDTGAFPFPADCLQIRDLHIEGQPDRPLRAMAPGAIAQEFDGRPGYAFAYAISGRTISLASPPAEPVTIALRYYQRIPALGAGRQTNWLLDAHPDLYLRGALLEAEFFGWNDDRLPLIKSAVDETLAEIEQAGQRNRWGGGPLVPNTVQQVRGARC